MGLWRVLSDLEEDGYRTEWGLFSAEETGAPHQRIRCFILAYTASREPRQSQARNGGQDTSGGSQEELANPKRRGCGKEGVSGGVEAIRRGKSNNSMPIKESDTRWPARPGEEQYEWEEPRTLKSCMGGTVNGTRSGVDPITNRVDRLRLLGNGVLPACAEIAWRTLWQRI